MRRWLHTPAVRRTRAVARKEVRQLLRDPLLVAFVFGIPAVQLLVFGYAIDQDVRHVPTAVVDHAQSAVSRRLVGQLEATQTLRVVARPTVEEAARRLLERGTVQVVVVVPADYARAFHRGRGAEISLLVDATDPVVARAVRAAADGLAARHNQRLGTFASGEGGAATRLAPGRRTRFGAEPELVRPRFLDFAVLQLYNPELRTAVFVVPGLLGVILTQTMVLMTALALVRERERGSFEFLIATPVRRGELMVGKLVPYVVVGLVQTVTILAAGLVFFRVPVVGNLLALLTAAAIFVAASLSLGLVISSVTATQYQATQLSFFYFLPSVLLSGFMFPFDAMPRPAQWAGELLPLTHFVRVCRGILLRGAGLVDLWPEVVAMLAFAVVGFVAATRLFHKRLD